jgi:hypothetical protein
MTVVEPGAGSGLVERVKNILIQPRAEWERIATERTGLSALLSGYILPLAVLAAACSFIGLVFIGAGAFGYVVRLPLVTGVVNAVLQIALTLAWVWVMGLIINSFATTFNSEKDETRANQLAAYSATAGLVASVFTILPALSILAAIGGIYSLVLLYIGLPRMMKTPEDKRVPYFITIIVVAIVAGIVAGAVLGAVRGAAFLGTGGFAGPFAARTAPPASVTLPGGQTLDTSEFERAAKQMEAMAANPQAAAQGAAISAEALRALLPDQLAGGFARTEISTGSSGAMMGVATATARYENGERSIELSVTDLGAAGAFASMAGAFGVQASREDANGYERTQTVNGRMVVEELDRAAGRAKYGVVAHQRVMIEAEGVNVGIDEVRNAVGAVGVECAEALAAQLPGAPG